MPTLTRGDVLEGYLRFTHRDSADVLGDLQIQREKIRIQDSIKREIIDSIFELFNAAMRGDTQFIQGFYPHIVVDADRVVANMSGITDFVLSDFQFVLPEVQGGGIASAEVTFLATRFRGSQADRMNMTMPLEKILSDWKCNVGKP